MMSEPLLPRRPDAAMVNPELEISPNTYYTPEEVATMLRVSRRNVLRLLEEGIARGVRIGRQWRILGRDLLDLPRQADEQIDRQLARSLLHLSEPAFTRAWDNDEDAVYDEL